MSRPLVLLDPAFYANPKVWKISPQAGYLLINAICWSVSQPTPVPEIPRSAFRFVAGPLGIDHDSAVDELLRVGFLRPVEAEDGEAAFVVNDFEKWVHVQANRPNNPYSPGSSLPPPAPPPRRETSPEVSKVRSDAGRTGGLKSGESRRSETLDPGSDGFDRENGYVDAVAAYPKGLAETKYLMKQAYGKVVDTAADHERVMRGIKNYADYQRWRSRNVDNGESNARWLKAFRNFLLDETYSEWQDSQVPPQQLHGTFVDVPEDEVKELEQ